MRRMARISYRPPDALMDLMYRQLGLGMDSMRLVLFVHEWALLEAKLGHRVTPDEYATKGPDSRATAYRRLELFRRVFPTLSTPVDLIVWPDGLPLPADVPADVWRLVAA